MLCELHLQNLAVAADVSLHLDPGLNVLTGSTGAGKSLVAEAVRWLSGASIDRGVLRKGAASASAEAVFDLQDRPELVSELRERGVELSEDGMLRLRREVHAQGRSRAWIDGRLGSAALLKSIAEVLIQSQAQHVQLGLLDPRQHVAVLDALGVDTALAADWHEARSAFESAQAAIARWQEQRDRLVEQREVLEYQRLELDAAALRDGELEELRRTVSLMEGGARLLELAEFARTRLDDDARGAVPAVQEALAQLRRAPDGIDDVAEVVESLEGAVELMRDASAHLERLLDGAEVDPRAFENAQERLSLFGDLMRKYGRTEAELIRLHARLTDQLDALNADAELPESLMAEERASRERLDAAGRALHAARKRVSRRAAADAGPLLGELGMEGAEIGFEFQPEPDPEGPVRIEGRQVAALPGGPAAVTLVARTNPGERKAPVHRAASGGELSRIALVLRSLSLRGQAPALLLLDEVDAGIGADLAPAVGRRLSALAESGQLLVITHQAHIAARASRHLVAMKLARGSRTESQVRELDSGERVDEMVRMIGTDTGDSRRLAERLLSRESAA
jgi:DNA repair protein RecN (Recombination protein N)